MSQCVSCNNQPNDNDSLGGASSEGTVTPVVIGIIVGTVAIFILVLCALFYCVKLENERTMRLKDEPPPSETGEAGEPAADGSGAGPPMGDNSQAGGDDLRAKPADFGGRRSSSITVVPDRVPRAAVATVGGKKRGRFGWGGRKGNSSLADNPPVTAIEMV